MRKTSKFRVLSIVLLVGLLSSLGRAAALPAAPTEIPLQTEASLAALPETGGQAQQQTPQSPNLYLPLTNSGSSAVESDIWSMPGANPERNSRITEEIPGKVSPAWYKVFEPYIPHRVQIITAYDTLYISTSAGLYALDAATGAEKWVYATEMPLGNSPTIADGVAYVGGFDRKLHAVNAFTGQPIWTFEAGAGFDTNPLVVEGKVLAGSRDGAFYALHASGANAGKLAWKYQTQGPIQFSAAYKDGVVYFASNDSHAYALNAGNGTLVWKSDKLPGAGFHSWWPVIYKDWVVFAGSKNYRTSILPGPGLQYSVMELQEVYPNFKDDPQGTYIGPPGHEPGDWVPGTLTLDTSRPNQTSNGKTVPITEYLEQKPWRRTYFVLNRANGEEYTTDFDGDNKPEYAPFLWFGTQGAGNRYPPVVGSDGVIYMTNNYMSDTAIADGQITGWKIGTPFISIITTSKNAVDEPIAYLAGGDIIYWNRCCDRTASAFDISLPFNEDERNREWGYFSYDLPELIPGYNEMTFEWDPYFKPYGGVYGGANGAYGWHGDVNPPVPYQGKIFLHGSNAVIAFSPQKVQPTKLPKALTPDSRRPAGAPLSEDQLKAVLAREVQKMIDAGHLRPGYVSSGIIDNRIDRNCGDDPVDYWHAPGETIVTLLDALEHLPSEMQSEARAYIQSEFENYPPYAYNHIGWASGAPREVFDLPPDVESDRKEFKPRPKAERFDGWTFNPYNFYALWKYAEEFGGELELFNNSKDKLNAPPTNAYLLDMPQVLNAYIAGYMGYLELAEMAKQAPAAGVQQEYERLLGLRSGSFSKDVPPYYLDDKKEAYCRSLAISRNFIYLTPELGQYLNDNALPKVQQAVDEYTFAAPYWFVAKFEAAFAEGVVNPLFDYQSIFQAKAWILEEPQQELVKYIDVPGVAVGDLFYIQNLVAAIEAGP